MFIRRNSYILSHQLKRLNVVREFCKVANEQQLYNNPYFEKYSHKIATFQKTSPEEFKALLEKGKTKHLNDCNSNTDSKKSYGSVSKQKQVASFVAGQKVLDEIVKLELLRDRSAEEIQMIWKDYFKEKNGLYSVLPSDSYEDMHSRFLDYPTFLFPLPKAEGYEFIMCQCLSHTCYFTSLINYQAFKENAPTCLTVSYYPDLKEEKGIVLTRGEFDEQSLKVNEAQCLTNQLQLYYSGKDSKKDKLLWQFNKQPETFKHIDLIKELDHL